MSILLYSNYSNILHGYVSNGVPLLYFSNICVLNSSAVVYFCMWMYRSIKDSVQGAKMLLIILIKVSF